MFLKKIILSDFRNYDKLELNFNENVNLITGKNAQGKTNLLESIYVLSFAKSFRTNKESEMILFNKEFAKIKGFCSKGDEDLDVEILYNKSGKFIKINGKKITRNIELLNNVYIVIFSPEDLKIVKEEPDKRRKFIDRELSLIKPVYYSYLVKYKKILQHRNALLKENFIDKGLLEVMDYELVNYGTQIMLYRNIFIEKLNKISGNLHFNITNQKESLELYYEPNIQFSNDLDIQKKIFLQKLIENREKDFKRRTSTSGPHKDDLKIIVNHIDVRHFGSQGQQRTAALSLKLAEIQLIKEETKENPILLLDDVLSELDQERQSFLINALRDVQLFITTTEMDEKVKESLTKGKTFIIDNGDIMDVLD